MTEGENVESQNVDSNQETKVDGCTTPKSEKAFSRFYKPQSKPWKCKVCDVDFTHFKFWVDHQLTQHPSDEKPITVYWINKPKRRENPPHFTNRKAQQQQSPPINDDDDSKSICGDSLCDATTEVSSKEEEEDDNEDETEVNNSFQCSKCPNVYSYKKSLVAHENACHDKTKTFHCDRCPESFLTNQQRYRHQKRSHPERFFKSKRRLNFGKQRGRQQSSNNNGRNSGKIEQTTDQATYKCAICPRRFTLLFGLQMHIVKTHKYSKTNQAINGKQSSSRKNNEKGQTSEYPFKCGLCPRQLDTSFGLKMHIIHSHQRKMVKSNDPAIKDKRKFNQKSANGQVPDCPNSSSSKAQEHVTKKTVNGKRVFACDFCKRMFQTIYQAVKHTWTHTGDEPFKCSTCLRTFTAKGSLKYHMENTHGKSWEEEVAVVTSRSSSVGIKSGGRRLQQKQQQLLKSKRKFRGSQQKNEGTAAAAKTSMKKTKLFRRRSTPSSACLTVVNGKRQHSPKISSKTFYRHSQGVIHSRTRRFKCPSCEKSYAWAIGLTKHQKTTGH